MEIVGGIRWRMSEECYEECWKTTRECPRNTMESVGGIRWRVSEDYDGKCRRNTIKSVGRL